jgi:hypothetical protein
MSSDYDDLAIIEQQLPRSKSRDLCKARLNVLHIGTLMCPTNESFGIAIRSAGLLRLCCVERRTKTASGR